MDEFYNVISKSWNTIENLSNKHKLVNVYKDKIEAIN